MITAFGESLRRQGRSLPAFVINDDPNLSVRHELSDAKLDLAARQRRRAGNLAVVVLAALAHVEERE